jgi:hypothetical protein
MTNGEVDNLATGKHLSIEIGSQLQVEIEGIPSRHQTTFIGMELFEYLIIKIPVFTHKIRSSGIKHKLFPGNQITVRYIYEGSVFGFQTELIEALFMPKRWLVLKYPEVIAQHDLRSEKRINCFLPAITKIKDKETHGIIEDINQNGCRYLIKGVKDRKLPPVQVDDLITLRCQFPGEPDEQEASGIVKNIKRNSQEMTLGIQFRKMTDNFYDIVSLYISSFKDVYESDTT